MYAQVGSHVTIGEGTNVYEVTQADSDGAYVRVWPVAEGDDRHGQWISVTQLRPAVGPQRTPLPMPSGPTQNRWYGVGYQAAMRDIATQFATGGEAAVREWVANNTTR